MPTLGIRVASPTAQPVLVQGRWYSSPTAAAKGPAPSPRRDRATLKATKQIDVAGVLSFLKRVS